MPDYTCPRCDYTSNIKTHLKIHLNRKKPCENKNNGPDNATCINQFYPVKKRFACPHCDKSFSRKDNLATHVWSYCKKFVKDISKYSTKTKPPKYSTETKKYSKEDVSILLEDTNRKSNDLMDQQKKEYEKKLEQLTNELKLAKGSNTNNIVNITINGYKHENTDYITSEVVSKIFKSIGFRPGLLELQTLKHFNKDHPENFNIKIPNKSKNQLAVYNGDNWELRPKDPFIGENITDDIHFVNNNCELDSYGIKLSNDYLNGKKEVVKQLGEDYVLNILNKQATIDY